MCGRCRIHISRRERGREGRKEKASHSAVAFLLFLLDMEIELPLKRLPSTFCLIRANSVDDVDEILSLYLHRSTYVQLAHEFTEEKKRLLLCCKLAVLQIMAVEKVCVLVQAESAFAKSYRQPFLRCLLFYTNGRCILECVFPGTIS